jgi:hypothetical protein
VRRAAVGRRIGVRQVPTRIESDAHSENGKSLMPYLGDLEFYRAARSRPRKIIEGAPDDLACSLGDGAPEPRAVRS